MHCRPYRSLDRVECLEVFASNTQAGPDWGITFFDTEQADYEAFLDQLPGPYYVVVEGGEVIGAGGFSSREVPQQAELQWWAVRRSRRHLGAGSLLMTTCINDLIADPFIERVRIVTTDEACGFFTRWGFAATGARAEASQIRRVEMRFELDETGKQMWSELITGGLEAPESEEPIPAIERVQGLGGASLRPWLLPGRESSAASRYHASRQCGPAKIGDVLGDRRGDHDIGIGGPRASRMGTTGRFRHGGHCVDRRLPDVSLGNDLSA